MYGALALRDWTHQDGEFGRLFDVKNNDLYDFFFREDGADPIIGT